MRQSQLLVALVALGAVVSCGKKKVEAPPPPPPRTTAPATPPPAPPPSTPRDVAPVEDPYNRIRGMDIDAINNLGLLEEIHFVYDKADIRDEDHVARRFGFAHRLISTEELANPLYARNAPDRCFHCKSELFTKLVPLAAAEGLAHVAYGAIVDDLQDYRPGHRAAAAAGARAPLAEAGLGKADVRELSRALGLPTWDVPASPCLSSRVAYGVSVTPPVLRQVERAEDALRALGFRELRVRHLGGGAARVEIGVDELPRLADAALRARVLASVAGAGYALVTIDAAGYRRGSLNDVLGDGPRSGVSSAHGAR